MVAVASLVFWILIGIGYGMTNGRYERLQDGSKSTIDLSPALKTKDLVDSS